MEVEGEKTHTHAAPAPPPHPGAPAAAEFPNTATLRPKLQLEHWSGRVAAGWGRAPWKAQGEALAAENRALAGAEGMPMASVGARM